MDLTFLDQHSNRVVSKYFMFYNEYFGTESKISIRDIYKYWLDKQNVQSMSCSEYGKLNKKKSFSDPGRLNISDFSDRVDYILNQFKKFQNIIDNMNETTNIEINIILDNRSDIMSFIKYCKAKNLYFDIIFYIELVYFKQILLKTHYTMNTARELFDLFITNKLVKFDQLVIDQTDELITNRIHYAFDLMLKHLESRLKPIYLKWFFDKTY